MAVSYVEEKILGRLAKQTEASNPLLSDSLYQVLGLSVLLARKTNKARKQRKLDPTRDNKSFQLYHHIIWLAKEGLSTTEIYILPYCQNGEQGPECRVMAAKLRASFYHIFCLYHNSPPVSQRVARSPEAGSTPSSSKTVRGINDSRTQNTSSKSPKNDNKSPKNDNIGRNGAKGKRRTSKAALRDPIPSMTSDASYVTNPYATDPLPVSPRLGFPHLSTEARTTPLRPPGLTGIYLSTNQNTTSSLLSERDFVPDAGEFFAIAQRRANELASTHALRLSVSYEHAMFLWDCQKDHERARRLATKTIQAAYSSPDGLSDDEFADASAIVKALGGIVRRGSNESSPRGSESIASPIKVPPPRKPPPPSKLPVQAPLRQPLNIDRTINVSPASRRLGLRSPSQSRLANRTPERLSTVPEVDSIYEATTQSTPMSPATSRLSSRGRPTRTSSLTSDKASKRRALEQAEEEVVRRQSRASSNNRSSPHSRQATPPEGYVRQSNANHVRKTGD